MAKKEMLLIINDELGIVFALLKTANMAIGNREYFGDDGQSIAITLDIIATKLRRCREMLGTLDGNQKDI